MGRAKRETRYKTGHWQASCLHDCISHGRRLALALTGISVHGPPLVMANSSAGLSEFVMFFPEVRPRPRPGCEHSYKPRPVTHASRRSGLVCEEGDQRCADGVVSVMPAWRRQTQCYSRSRSLQDKDGRSRRGERGPTEKTAASAVALLDSISLGAMRARAARRGGAAETAY